MKPNRLTLMTEIDPLLEGLNPQQAEAVTHAGGPLLVVAGAGFTGVEVVGELEEWIRRTLIFKYPTLSMNDINIHLIDGAPRILGAFGEKASKKGHKHMEKLGINIILNQFISKVTPTSVHFGDTSIDSELVIWTSGVTCEPISKEQHDVQRGNRIPVESSLESSAKKDAYILFNELINT